MDIDRLDQITTGREEQPERRIYFGARRDEKPACGCLMHLLGAHSERETPVPMPNTAVKPLSGYNTWA